MSAEKLYTQEERLSDYSDDISDDSHVDQDSPKKGVAMLSLLSYYGVQDEASAEDIAKNPEAFIDLPQFDPKAYVKKLLLDAPMEELLSKDSQMVQEIRTLDSDMQMLVYENYNKFISATETIKRMKVNVEVMDEDMDHVKRKMESICAVSAELDNSLHNQRVKVDKIMRIKRLLNRLEFLTELPERLQELIKQEMYQKAVTLYNKTINVLTKHSGVLSLKNIKERTELMMIDLRAKVTNLLDDPTLDTIKLTQYVTILRMMQAPKPMVVQKLLAAHVSRARSMIKSFQTADSDPTALNRSDSTEAVSTGITLSRTRKFHQLLLAGLIEACKGIHELFCNSAHLSTDSVDGSSTRSSSVIDYDKTKRDMKDHESAHKQLVAAVEDVIVSNYSNMMIHQVATFFHEYRTKFAEVRSMELKLKSLSAESIDEYSRSIINEASREPTEKELLERNLRMLQLRLYDLEDECQNWLLLARQAILDIIFLETSIVECSPLQNGNRLRHLSVDAAEPDVAISSPSFEASTLSFARSFANDLLNVVGQHADYLFWRHMMSFAESFNITVNNLESLCDFPTTSDQGTLQNRPSDSHGMETSSHGSGSGDPLSIRYEIQRRIGEAKSLYDKSFDAAVATFADILTDMKPIIEVYQTVLPNAKPSKSSHHVPSSIPDSISGLFYFPRTKSQLDYWNVQRNILGAEIGKISTTGNAGHEYIAHIIWSFCSAISQIFEIHSGVSYDKRIFSAGLGCFMNDNDDGIEELSISTNLVTFSSGLSGTDTTLRAKALQTASLDTESMINNIFSTCASSYANNVEAVDESVKEKSFYALAASNFLKRVSPSILNRLDAELKAQEYPTSTKDSVFKAKCGARLELAAYELLSNVVEKTSLMSRYLTIRATLELHDSARLSSPSAPPLDVDPYSQDSRLSNPIDTRIIQLCQLFHDLCIYCCIFLGEMPPQLKSSTGGTFATGNTAGRRGGRSSLMPNSNATGVHLDIERLFSQKIRVYDFGPGADNLSTNQIDRPQLVPTIDVIVGTCAKVSVKAMYEHIRLLTVSHKLYVHLQVQIGVIKQMAAFVMRETNEVDSLVDQLNGTMFSRYVDANNLSNFIGGGGMDNKEGMLVTRAINQSIQDLTKSCVLLPKH